VAAAPGNDEAMATAVELYSVYGLTEKARPLVLASLASEPTARSLYNKARIVDASDPDKQLPDLDQALRLDPHFAPALVLRAEVRGSLGRHDEALADIEEALRIFPASTEALKTRASLLAETGKFEPALTAVDTAIAANPKSLDLYLQKANLLRRMGRRDDALKVPAAMVTASPEETYAHVAAAKIYEAFGQRSQALAEIDRALAIKPEAYIYMNRAEVLPADDLAGRLADVEQALKMEPENSEALMMKARLLTRKGDHAAAAQLWSAMVEKEPKNAYYLDQRAIALWRAGKRDEAQRDFAAERTFAKGAEQLNNLCFQKAMANVDLDLALDQCQESLRLVPGAIHVLDSRGTVFLGLGRYSEAKSDFDSVLEKSPGQTTSLMGRAIARLHLGDLAGARADAAAARKLDSDAVEHYRAAGFAVPAELAT